MYKKKSLSSARFVGFSHHFLSPSSFSITLAPFYVWSNECDLRIHDVRRSVFGGCVRWRCSFRYIVKLSRWTSATPTERFFGQTDRGRQFPLTVASRDRKLGIREESMHYRCIHSGYGYGYRLEVKVRSCHSRCYVEITGCTRERLGQTGRSGSLCRESEEEQRGR